MRAPAVLVAACVAAAVVTVPVTVIAAAPALAGTATSIAQLQTDLAGCTGTTGAPFTEVLGADVSATASEIVVGCVATLDLNSHSLDVQDVKISAAQQLTIADQSAAKTGALDANASQASTIAGISTTSAKLVVSSGKVTAVGGPNAAGIGGNANAAGGTVDLTGGEVITLGGNGSAVGAGNGNTGFGSLAVDGGILRLPAGNLVVPDSNAGGPEITIASGAVLTGGLEPIVSYATITGAGQIKNDGVIDMPTNDVTGGGVTVSDRHYDVTFDTAGGSTNPDPVTVYADTFTHGDRTFPPDPTKPGYTFTQWETTGGTHVTKDTDLEIFGNAQGTTTHDALPIGLVAQYTLNTPDSNLPALETGLSTCTGTAQAPYAVTLTKDLSDVTAELTVNCVAIMDLGSHSLTVRDVVIGAGDKLTTRDTSAGATGSLTADASASTVPGIATTSATSAYTAESGTVTIKGGGFSAGIGGDLDHPGGVVTVSGGTVHATGGSEAAGIGSGSGDTHPTLASGTLTVSGGTVDATGGIGGAGVGSGQFNNGGALTVTVTGGSLTGTGGQYGAGVGGGRQGSGGTVLVSGGTLTASGNGNAIGAGTSGLKFGSLVITGSGTVRLTGNEFVLDSDPNGPEIALSGGLLTGSADPTPSYATISGAGQIQNAGVIDMPEADVSEGGVTVSDRHYDVTFDVAAGTSTAPAPVTVYADTFTDGLRTFPADPTPPAGQLFTGWVGAASGSPALVTTDTNLLIFGTATGTTASGALPITLVATYRPQPTITGTPIVGKVLTAHQAAPGPAGPTITYTWIRIKGGVSKVIPGATKKTYTLATADDGSRVRVVTTVSQFARRATTQASAPTAVVDLPTLKTPMPPQIQFPTNLHPHVGKSLVAAFAHNINGQGGIKNLKHVFQWFAGGTAVGTNQARLTITKAMIGKPITVRVTYSAPGYHPVSVTSKPTKPVVPTS